jgi:hypothetical protein
MEIGKANILIIDDEESIRFSFGGFLASEGHNWILPTVTRKLWQEWMKQNLKGKKSSGAMVYEKLYGLQKQF